VDAEEHRDVAVIDIERFHSNLHRQQERHGIHQDPGNYGGQKRDQATACAMPERHVQNNGGKSARLHTTDFTVFRCGCQQLGLMVLQAGATRHSTKIHSILFCSTAASFARVWQASGSSSTHTRSLRRRQDHQRQTNDNSILC
jgi:hypothetical protein